MGIMTHVLLIVGWSLTVNVVSTANKVVYISCKLAKTPPPSPRYLLPESGWWRVEGGQGALTHSHNTGPVCVGNTPPAKLFIKSHF